MARWGAWLGADCRRRRGQLFGGRRILLRRGVELLRRTGNLASAACLFFQDRGDFLHKFCRLSDNRYHILQQTTGLLRHLDTVTGQLTDL